ncbi:hypothetical protein AOLI_G00227690 [Acnodon oligacanthus]
MCYRTLSSQVRHLSLPVPHEGLLELLTDSSLLLLVENLRLAPDSRISSSQDDLSFSCSQMSLNDCQ